jgi:nucleoside-diphosphate-sugar epimerase
VEEVKDGTVDRSRLVVVTGAGGFIGGHLVARLRRDGFRRIRAVDWKPVDQWEQHFDDVENLVLDLSRRDHADEAVLGAAYVFNLAAEMGGMGFIEANKAACMLSVLANTHMLIAARDHEVDRFFFSSSACVYAADKQETADVAPLREEDAYPAMPEDGYGWEKLFTERMARHFYEDFGLETRMARYHNVYGPLTTWDGGREKAPAAICRKVATAVLTGNHEIEIWGDGQQTRSFMYIDDCVEGTLRLAWSDFREPINIGSSELVTIDELVTICEEIAGVRLRRRYKLDAPLGVRGRNSDNTRILAEFGWEPRTPLADGLAVTYRWIYDQLSARLATVPAAIAGR